MSEAKQNPRPLGRGACQMTHEQATGQVGAILDEMALLGLTPDDGGPFTLAGGNLEARPHPELPTHWRPVWQPHEETLLLRELDGFSPRVAAEQIARYRHSTYLVVRRKLEDLLKVLNDEQIETYTNPDSFLVDVVGLDIVERDGKRNPPEFALEIETHPLPELVEQGRPPPDSRVIDVTKADQNAILALVRGEAI